MEGSQKEIMQETFITEIKIEKVRHLKNINLKLSDTIPKHLIFTGKNGSGKTSVLDAIAQYLNLVISFSHLITNKTEDNLPGLPKHVTEYYKLLNQTVDKETDTEIVSPKGNLSANMTSLLHTEMKESDIGIELSLNDSWESFYYQYKDGKFLTAYYKCDRIFHAEPSEHVEKISLDDSYGLTDTPRNLFIKYLVDLKVTEALARSRQNIEKADAINDWFLHFENLLQRIFEDQDLKLEFNEDTFEFTICQNGKEPYSFNYMSSGFSAIMDIVLDLMIRMVKLKGRVFEFDLPGIVLIDEIETHLHLELQKKIMDILTSLFPNIQFIVSTHSPFVLNSLENVVIYDLENHTVVPNGLADVPYEGIVEGYFKVDTLSDMLKKKFEEYKMLVHKPDLTDDDFEKIANLEMFLDEVPDYLALDITTEYQQLKEELAHREDI